MNRSLAFVFMLVLSACSAQDEPLVLEEPVLDIAQDGVVVCSPDDEDGIGGTGCEPVARQALEHTFTE